MHSAGDWAGDREVAQGAGGVYWSEEVEVIESASGISSVSCVLALGSTCTVFCPGATTTRSVEEAPSRGERSLSNSATAVADVRTAGMTQVWATCRRRIRGRKRLFCLLDESSADTLSYDTRKRGLSHALGEPSLNWGRGRRSSSDRPFGLRQATPFVC